MYDTHRMTLMRLSNINENDTVGLRCAPDTSAIMYTEIEMPKPNANEITNRLSGLMVSSPSVASTAGTDPRATNIHTNMPKNSPSDARANAIMRSSGYEITGNQYRGFMFRGEITKLPDMTAMVVVSTDKKRGRQAG
jgi:hypothetical protein